ncbi:hypothetical protein [Metallibacterium sp.]|jgi:tRNA(Glu) U13 pseudouridine synthase TruD|uniref:hypothetical protein n=1 Tax=Metallibacterium sp. TaxID=2940281 RepID=UPI002629CC00|nr:hypothetical protein [Metallibacterium sp.]
MSAEHDVAHAGLPRAWGAPPLHGVLRAQPEDFVVEAVLGSAADGAGAYATAVVQELLDDAAAQAALGDQA